MKYAKGRMGFAQVEDYRIYYNIFNSKKNNLQAVGD